ncbi:MAG: hypothetical protein GYB42_06790 [Alphaproteobacteria bacterium]|nr:hypothetical protein [Alphaproteobacteria bacterium]
MDGEGDNDETHSLGTFGSGHRFLQPGPCWRRRGRHRLELHVTDDEVSFCAYTGCWQGAPTSVAHAGRFTTYTGLDLDFSSQSSWTADAVLSIDTQTGTGTILVADIYAQPVTCTPWSPPQE